jgi:hypothetical protein
MNEPIGRATVCRAPQQTNSQHDIGELRQVTANKQNLTPDAAADQ